MSSRRVWGQRVTGIVAVVAVALSCAGGPAAATRAPTSDPPAAQSAALVEAAAAAVHAAAPVAPADSGEALTATAGERGGEVALPVDPTSPVRLTAADGTAMHIALPFLESATAQDAVVTEGGTVVYPSEGPDLAVQALDDGGVRALVTIPDAAAPREYTFDVAVPPDVSPAVQDDGSVLYLDAAGDISGGLDAPWAKDAAGNDLPTRYSVHGSSVTQHVEFLDGTVFPVVLDPSGWWGWLRCSAAIGAFLAGNLLAASKITKLGGVAKVIRTLKAAKSSQERYKALLYFFGEFAGIDAILTHCR